MRQHDMTTPKLEVAADFTLDVSPMLGAVIITFRSQLADVDAGTTSPVRETTPIALTPDIARAIHQTLGQAIAAFGTLGVREGGVAPAGKPTN